MHLIDFRIDAPIDTDVMASTMVADDYRWGPTWINEVVQIPCIRCSGFNAETAPLRQVIGTGVTPDAGDPSVMFRLSCGHTAL